MPKPNKPADRAIGHLRQQLIQPIFRCPVELRCDPAVYPSLGRDKRICAQALDHRHTGQEGLDAAAFLDKSPRQIAEQGLRWTWLSRPRPPARISDRERHARRTS
jgi:hypothetical protein